MAKPKSKKRPSVKKSRGHLIVFEGPDGVGKSTIAAGVAEALKLSGEQCRLLSFPGREPGSLGKLIYSLHHDLSAHGIAELSPTALQALHVAAHIDVMERVILPSLRAGTHIVLDRYWWSTMVYGLSTGIGADTLDALIEPERQLWGDQTTVIFLVDRDKPINRDEDPRYWQKLRGLYDAYAAKEETRSEVVRLRNLADVKAAIWQALDALAKRKIIKAIPVRRQSGKHPDKVAQLSIEFGADVAGVRSSKPPSITVHSRIAPATPTIVLDSYWRFAAERQDVFFRRLQGARRPWTTDPIIEAHKFTNAYRASDRVSQFLIRHVIYRPDLPKSADEVCFRILLFKLFNKIETWQLLEEKLGPIVFEEYRFKRYDQVLVKALDSGRRIYSAAYIMPPGGRAFGHTAKHQNHLRLLEKMMREELPAKLVDMRRMQDAFELLLSYPTIGDFLAYQFITDINYSEVTNFTEMEFVMPGPGALDGIRKCFSNLGGLNEPEIIRLMADIQSDEFARLGLRFRSLFGRPLQLIDCQNLFCEVDKYARVAHPEYAGRTGRSRIKQKFAPIADLIDFWYPPKWEINDAITDFRRHIAKTAA